MDSNRPRLSNHDIQMGFTDLVDLQNQCVISVLHRLLNPEAYNKADQAHALEADKVKGSHKTLESELVEISNRFQHTRRLFQDLLDQFMRSMQKPENDMFDANTVALIVRRVKQSDNLAKILKSNLELHAPFAIPRDHIETLDCKMTETHPPRAAAPPMLRLPAFEPKPATIINAGAQVVDEGNCENVVQLNRFRKK